MREKLVYMLDGNEEDIDEMLSKLNPNAYKYDSINLYIYTDDESFQILQIESNRLNVRLISCNYIMEYKKEDINNSELFHLMPNTYCSNFPEEYGTIYSDDIKCKACGAGKRQVSELYIDKSKMGKKDISMTYGGETVVSERLYNLLCENNINGINFARVHHKNNKMNNEPQLYQLLVTNSLFKMSNQTRFLKENYCDYCHKSGLVLRSIPYYQRENLKNAKDFNNTYEYFGCGLLGIPFIIVNQKVYRLFKDNKIKGVSFDVVKII